MKDARSAIAQPIVGYLLLVGFCLFFLFVGRDLGFGSLAQIGPGFFPTVLAVLLLVMSLAGAAIEWRKHGSEDGTAIDWRPLVFICLAILVFALLVRRVGLIPASIASAAVAGLAEHRIRPIRLAIVAVGIGAFVWLIFVAGLELSISAFRMPF